MLPPDWIIDNLDDIQEMLSDFHTSILESVAKHVRDTFDATNQLGLMPSTVTQIHHAQAAGLLRSEIMKHIAHVLKVSVAEIQVLFDAAIVESLKYDNEVYREAGLPDVVIRQSPTLHELYQAGIEKQMGKVKRLTGTIAINAEQLFERTLNTAYNKVISGTHSYTEALREGIDDMRKEGVTTFNYESGRRISVEAALLMNIRTGVSQTAGHITHTAMIERNVGHCETSAHIGARNTGEGFVNHESWQGRVFFLNGATEEYADFYIACGYGDVQGIYGANCRHSHRPFFPGITEPRWTPEKLKEYASKEYTFTGADGKKKTVGAYAASQIMRRLEREIRDHKRKIAVFKAAGLDAPRFDKDNLKAVQARLKRFREETGMKRQHIREQI